MHNRSKLFRTGTHLLLAGTRDRMGAKVDGKERAGKALRATRAKGVEHMPAVEVMPGYQYQPLQKEEDKAKDESLRYMQQHKRNALNVLTKAGSDGQAMQALQKELDELEETRQALRPIHVRILGREHSLRKAKERLEQARIRMRESAEMLEKAKEEFRKEMAALRDLEKLRDAQAAAAAPQAPTMAMEQEPTIDVMTVKTIKDEAERRHKEVMEQQQKRFDEQMKAMQEALERQHEEKMRIQAEMLATKNINTGQRTPPTVSPRDDEVVITGMT
eukprot:TRINITY_DN23751_c0_g1_i5.p4 TRINITY_DN23751_c0_g1~~TRINITY_DN23751_c0_g1_i5.p4  ORF type:complete len:275 (-),score=81.39 TRINITY_DN23751_c0_g1_i5:4742-5566(-)